MRRKKIEGILCLTGMLLLTGCGTKAYDLTEAEESQIVNYAVHVVSKHNSYQKDGLVYVDQSVEETEPEEQPEEAPEEINRYAALNVTEDDIDMLAALAWHEARGEPFDGQVAVVLTALNRCLSPEFPDTVEEVVFQKYGDVCTTQITFFPPKRYFSAQRHTTTISLQSSEITSFVLLRRSHNENHTQDRAGNQYFGTESGDQGGARSGGHPPARRNHACA